MDHPNPLNLVLSTRPVLPRELEDLVIDHLHDDILALSACAIVCSNWLPRTRQHLFRSITLSCGKLRCFRNLLDNAPAIGACIRFLAVDCAAPRVVDCLTCIQLGMDSDLEFFDLLRPMENLRRLEAARLKLEPTSLPMLESLEELRLTRNRFFCVHMSLNRFVDWLFELPHLRSLTATSMSFLGPSETLTPDVPTTTSPLSDVHLWSWQNHDFCTTLARRLVDYGVANRLRCVSMLLSDEDFSVALLESILALVRSLGPALTHLELGLLPHLSNLDVPYSSLTEELWGCLTLSQCPNLRHLRLLGCFGTAHDPRLLTFTMDWVVGLLSALACTGIEVITFVLDPDMFVLHIDDDWMDEMFGVLASEPSVFLRLERIVFELCTAYASEEDLPQTGTRKTEIAKHIAMRWGRWRRKGIAYEVSENETPPDRWGQRGEDGSVVTSARTILVSADGKQPFQFCD
ncbi:hypothetical protein V8D89_003195 [Ganoderma adspersum]